MINQCYKEHEESDKMITCDFYLHYKYMVLDE
jgi:hypothetical protein